MSTAIVSSGQMGTSALFTKRLYENGLLQTFGGLCTLAVVMGIGRFLYTALLPGMMHTYALDEKVAGIMAAWNYAGYLAGVLAVRKEIPGLRRYALFAFFLLLSLVTTAGMGLVHTNVLRHTMRFLSGFASGGCFVLCSAIVLDTLVMIERPVLAGFLYSGVGTGIVLGGVTALPMEAAVGSDGAWIGMALLCVPPAIISLIFLRPSVNQTPVVSGQSPSMGTNKTRGQRHGYFILLAVYFLEGFGYIIGTTFLVTLVQTSTNSPELAGASWIITGCAAAISAPLWRYAARRGYLPMLLLAYLLQAVGMLLPVISTSVPAILIGGLLLGGTFMGIGVLGLQYGVFLSGKPSAHTIAVMTAVYGVGQIIGPFVVGFTAQGQGFGLAFALSSASIFLGAGLLFIGNLKQKRP